MPYPRMVLVLAGATLGALAQSGCATTGGEQLPPASFVAMEEGPGEDYVIGPLDELTIYVWRNPELGANVQVRPDGRITTPLVTDMPAVGKTPSKLQEDIRETLSQYITDPIVSVIVYEKASAPLNPAAGVYVQVVPQVTVPPAAVAPADPLVPANVTVIGPESPASSLLSSKRCRSPPPPPPLAASLSYMSCRMRLCENAHATRATVSRS